MVCLYEPNSGASKLSSGGDQSPFMNFQSRNVTAVGGRSLWQSNIPRLQPNPGGSAAWLSDPPARSNGKCQSQGTRRPVPID